MKDIIWTVILIWLVFQVTKLFRLPAAARQQTADQSPSETIKKKSAAKKSIANEGEYVDFEEIP